MYSLIIPKIKEILEGIKAVKAVYPYPLDGSPKSYPAVIFYPDQVENVYSDDGSNELRYKFKIWVVVDLSGTDEEGSFTSILPNVVDKIITEFGKEWSHQINNQRAWLVIDSGVWGMSEENKSKRAFAELSLTFRVSEDI